MQENIDITFPLLTTKEKKETKSMKNKPSQRKQIVT